MSLAIETDAIEAVLLADGWHNVSQNTFALDAYEYKDGSRTVLTGGTVAGVVSTGFFFNATDGQAYMGPLTSVLAVRTRSRLLSEHGD